MFFSSVHGLLLYGGEVEGINSEICHFIFHNMHDYKTLMEGLVLYTQWLMLCANLTKLRGAQIAGEILFLIFGCFCEDVSGRD